MEDSAKIYSPEFIYSFKEKCELTEGLLLIFEEINELFKTSSQYIDMKKRINLNVKWKLKKKDEVNIIMNALNRICKSNYEAIRTELANTTITVSDDLYKIANNMVTKMMCEVQFIEIYSQLIHDILLQGKWIVDGNPPETFRKAFLKRMQELYGDIENDKFDRNFFKILYSLHSCKIVGTNLVRHVMDDLKRLYESTKNERYMEYFIILWHLNTSDYNDYVADMRTNLSKRLQFMMDDNPCEETLPLKVKKQEVVDNSKYINYIVYIDEFNSIDEMLNDVCKECNCIDFLHILLKYTIDEPKGIDLVIKIVKTGLDRKYWKSRDVVSILENIKKHDMADILVDAPYFSKHMDRIGKVVNI